MTGFIAEENLPELIIETGKESNSWDNFHSNRIVKSFYIISKLLDLRRNHVKLCTSGDVQFMEEVRKGLLCDLTFEYDLCNRKFIVNNEEPVNNTLNVAAVWAAVTSGIGFVQFENVLNMLDAPAMCKYTLIKNEQRIEKVWEEHLQKSLLEAGGEQCKLALQHGDIDDDGSPFIKVIVNGGWSKRSYGHNYIASSGVCLRLRTLRSPCIIVMAKVHVTNVVVLDNPSPFLNPFQFEITFECTDDLQEDLEWKIIYVGSAESEAFDQVLDTVYVGPVPQGRHKFVFQADPPDPSKIPVADVVGVTVVLLTCSYRGQEFIRVGYYVNNDYIDPENRETQSPNAPQYDKLQRNILATSPRVTRFKVDWDDSPGKPNN